MFTLIKTFYAMLLGKEGETARMAAYVILTLLLGFLLVVGIAVYRYLSPSKLEQQIENRAPVITENQSNINATQPQIDKSKSDVDSAKKTSQNASKHTQEVIHKDSNQYANDNSGERFCERFPEDSTCK